MTETPLLTLDNISVEFGDVRRGGSGTVAVDQVSLAIPGDAPGIVNIVGESGSGKTTTARALLGLQRPSRGLAAWRGRDIYALDKKQMVAFRREVQAVFQDPYGIYNPYYPVDRVFDLAIKKFGLASSSQQKKDLIEDALQAVRLRPPDVLGRFPHQLSGGERQRIMLARAYLLRPKVIIADEAISMLDVAVRATIMNILLDFKSEFGVSTVFITHDLSAAYYLGGDVLIMQKGRVVELGSYKAILENPAHPYTQQLLQSIPSADPDQRWEPLPLPPGDVPLDRLSSRSRCLFAEQCPSVEPVCWQRRPAYRLVREQYAACVLYAPEHTAGDQSPTDVSNADMNGVGV